MTAREGGDAKPDWFGGRREQRGRRNMRRLYLIAAAGLAALVPLILFAGFWIRSELNKGQHDVESYLAGRAAALSRRIDAEIEQQLIALRAVSVLPALDEATDFGPTGGRVLAAMPHWSALALIDAEDGRALSSTRPDWPAEAALKLLPELRDSRRPRIETANEVGLTGTDILVYVPVVRNDRARSILLSSIKAADLTEIIAEQTGRSESASLIDSRNAPVTAGAGAESLVKGGAAGSLAAAIAGKASGVFLADAPGGGQLSNAFTRSPLTNWTAVVSMDREQIDRMAARSVWATIAAGTLSLILAGILAVFIVHTVMERRVSDERLAASRALGELDARLLATTQEALTEQRKSSSEREVLLREIYHRVKNNLQIVQSLLRLGSRDLKPEQREPFEAAVRRVGAMARVHTLLYNSPDLASIDFKDYLEELIRELSEGFGADDRRIASELTAESMRVPLDMAVPLAFIAVEILTNSYRHAFPEGRSGKIRVEIGRDEPFGTLLIEDDGIGFRDDPGSRRRLGLTIVRKLVQQIGGAIEEPGPGSSTFVIRFPLEEHAAEGHVKPSEVAIAT